MNRCCKSIYYLLTWLFWGSLRGLSQSDPLPLELGTIVDSGPPRLVWSAAALEPSDGVRIEVYESDEGKWRVLGNCPASQGYFRIYPSHLDPARYRLVVEERYTLVPLEFELERETLLKSRSGALEPPRMMQLDYRLEPEGPWVPQGMMESSNVVFRPVDPSWTYLDVRFRYDEVVAEDYLPPDKVTSALSKEFFWEAPDATADYLTLSFSENNEYQVFRTIEADQASIIIQLEDLPDLYTLPQVEAWVEGTSTILPSWLRTHYVATWVDQPGTNIVGYQVETWTGFPMNKTIAQPPVPADVRHDSGVMDFIALPPEVRRLSSWENRTYEDFNFQELTESLAWDEGNLPDNPLALQWRDANHPEWQLRKYLHSGTTQTSDIYVTPHIRDYRIVEAVPRHPEWVAGEISVAKDAVPHSIKKSWATLENGGSTIRLWFPTHDRSRYILETSPDGLIWESTSVELNGNGEFMPVETPLDPDAKSAFFRLKTVGYWR